MKTYSKRKWKKAHSCVFQLLINCYALVVRLDHEWEWKPTKTPSLDPFLLLPRAAANKWKVFLGCPH